MPDNDLISRSALLEIIGSMSTAWEYGQAVIDIYEIIKKQPAVDAAPVVHARWIQYEPDLHGTKPLECGACHYLFARLYPRDFCPHCGAKMEGGETDGKS